MIAGSALLPLTVSAASDVDKRLQSAAQAFKEVMDMPDKAIPQDLLDKAQCIVIIPDLKKGAFIVGGKYGKGFVSCRKKDGVGWSAPGSIRIEGGSVGFQIGGAESDVFMLIMNTKGMDRLLSTKFTLGGEASVAAGPVAAHPARPTWRPPRAMTKLLNRQQYHRARHRPQQSRLRQ